MARPQEYNREDVLESAIEVFRQQGYGATSIPNLVQATGLQPGSLYAAFGSKKGLLIEALETYSKQNLNEMEKALSAQPSALESLFAFLKQTSQQCQSSAGKRGCLMMNMLLELSTQDEEIAALLQKLIDRIEHRLVLQLERAISQGEVDSQQDPKALAKFILTNIWGLRVLGRRALPGDAAIVVHQVISYLQHCAR